MRPKTMKKIAMLLALMMVATILVTVVAVPAYAVSNEWVSDEPNVVSADTAKYIKDLNEKTFANYATKPQFAVVVVDHYPSSFSSMDEYKNRLFNEYGVGTAKENHGVLFVLAIKDRQYGLEIGDGFEKGSLIREDLSNDFIKEDSIIGYLRTGDYDTVCLRVAQKIAGIMEDEANGIYAQRETDLENETAQTIHGLKQALFIIVTLVVSVIGGLLIIGTYGEHKDKKMLANAFEKNKKFLDYLHVDPEEFKVHILDMARYEPLKSILDDFQRNLWEYYTSNQIYLLYSHGMKYPLEHSRYIMRYNAKNSLHKFICMDLVPFDEIAKEVDADIERENKITQGNINAFKAYVEKHFPEVDAPEVDLEDPDNKEKVIRDMTMSGYNCHHLYSEEEIEKKFKRAIQNLRFDIAYDKFIAENKDKIDYSLFRNREFKEYLQNSKEYRTCNYHDNTWMFLLLMQYTHDRQVQRQRYEEHQRQLAQERARQQQQDYNNDIMPGFGSSFGGGFSSGGGFSGSW